MEGDCIVSKCRGQEGRIQGLDVWHAHSGLVGQHSEKKQQALQQCVPHVILPENSKHLILDVYCLVLSYMSLDGNSNRDY